MSSEQKQETSVVELICSECNLPIAGDRPRTDVTRYLSETSRCQCAKNPATTESASSPKPRTARAVELKVAFSVEDANQILSDRFEVISFLGQGGMGSVFKAKERDTEKIFAVKLLNPDLIDDDHSVRRFEQEAKAAMHLTHPHLAAVYEFGIGKNNTPYLVMDFLEGTTLDQLLQKEKYLDHRRAIDLFIQICEAIEYAHYKGVIHRDIKPNNIIVTKPQKDLEFAKLFDFGIAKVLSNQAIDFTQDMTQTGELFGSPLYMSPEQCRGANIDEKTDLYSFGCVMYKSLTGKHPFEGKNFIDTIVRIISTEPEKLTNVNPTDRLPQALEQLVHRCLSKDTKYRYQSASALKVDLECVRDGRPISKQDTADSQAQSVRQGRRGIYAAIMLMVLLVAVIAMTAVTVNLMDVHPVTGGSVGGSPGGSGGSAGSMGGGGGVGGTRLTTPDPYKDANYLDTLSYTYFSQGKYEQAIPLLEFGIKTYKENGKTSVGVGREDNFLAENYSHLGKCYLMLKRYKEAVPHYREALRMFRKWGDYQGGMMTEAVNDYAEVLRRLDKNDMANNMLDDYRAHKNLTSVPDPGK